jgi:predicted ATP-dependent serine protease
MYGKCPACSSWGTLQEELIPVVSANTNAIATFSHLGTAKSTVKAKPRESLNLSQITDNDQARSLIILLQQIPIKPTTKEPTSKAQSRCHNDETN